MKLFNHAHNHTHIKTLQFRLEKFLTILLAVMKALKPVKEEVELEVVEK